MIAINNLIIIKERYYIKNYYFNVILFVIRIVRYAMIKRDVTWMAFVV